VTTFSFHNIILNEKKKKLTKSQTTLSHGIFIKHMECKNRNTNDQK